MSLPPEFHPGFLKVRSLSLADGDDAVAYLLKTETGRGVPIELDLSGNTVAQKRLSRMFPGEPMKGSQPHVSCQNYADIYSWVGPINSRV